MYFLPPGKARRELAKNPRRPGSGKKMSFSAKNSHCDSLKSAVRRYIIKSLKKIRCDPGMADKLKVKSAASPRDERDKLLRVLVVVAVFLTLVGMLVFGMLGMRRALFTGNPRLVLREVRIQTVGFWDGKEKELARRLALEPGQNLFELNMATLRQRLQSIPNVEHGEAVRVLPDRTVVKVVER